jgi:hypothetical protein
MAPRPIGVASQKGTATLTDNGTARRRLELFRFATIDQLNISGIIDPPFRPVAFLLAQCGRT